MTTTPLPPAQTALMPLDPAVSPQQALRILPIRADLLPGEITAGRNARRTRTILIFAVVLTLILLGGWFVLARSERGLVDQDLAGVTQQIDTTRSQTKNETYQKVTGAIEDSATITEQLKIAMGSDLPWNVVLEKLRSTGVQKITITSVSGALKKDQAPGAAVKGAPAQAIGQLTVNGEGPDKRTIALYVEAAAKVTGVTNAYLTSASEQDPGKWVFALTADISSSRLCGQFTTTCKDGGK